MKYNYLKRIKKRSKYTREVWTASLGIMLLIFIGLGFHAPKAALTGFHIRDSRSIKISQHNNDTKTKKLSKIAAKQSPSSKPPTKNIASTAASRPVSSLIKPGRSKGSSTVLTGSSSHTTVPTLPSTTIKTLYADPGSDVATNADAWANAGNTDSQAMKKLAAVPMAQWFGDFSGSNIQTLVANYVTAAYNQSSMPVLVAYNIPQRDCGSYSSGGAATDSAYRQWIDSFAQGIGQNPAIVILEPDALAGMSCLSSTDQQARLQLLSYAVTALKANSNTKVYIDAGNPDWQSASVMAQRLKEAGISQADGFSLNVSNFVSTQANISYGDQISSLVNGKHFVIDTSRNGNASANGQWCNPSGQAFGNLPTLNTGVPLVDGYLWIKNPGESDGSCGPSELGSNAPSAGTWWPQYAEMLENNSGW